MAKLYIIYSRSLYYIKNSQLDFDFYKFLLFFWEKAFNI